jgi:hypothetical protein
MRVPTASTDRFIHFVAVDSSDLKTRKTGLATWTVNSSLNGGASSPFTTPTVEEVSAANQPGVYRLLLDQNTTINAAHDTEELVLHITHAGMAPVTRVVEIYRPETTEGQTSVAQTGNVFAQLPVNFSSLAIAGPGSVTAGIISNNAVSAAALATDAVNEIRDSILSDGIAFPGQAVIDTKSRQVVYEEGAIWIDLIGGSGGSTDFVNGISRNPVNGMTDANILSASLKLSRFKVAPSNISNIMTLPAAQEFQYFDAQGAWINLNGQSVNGTGFKGCLVLGTCTGSGNFEMVTLAASSYEGGIFWQCALAGKVTLAGTTSYYFSQCFGAAADPTVDFGAAVGSVTVFMQDYSGELNIDNLGASGSDVLNLSGSGHLILSSSCTGGTVNIRGNWNLTNNGSGITINQEARYSLSRILSDSTAFAGADIADIKSRQIVYEEGSVWVDNAYGTSGTVPDVNGTSKNPSDGMLNAVIIAAAKNLSRYKVAPGSNMIVPSNRVFEHYDVWGAYVDLNSKSLVDCVIQGARSVIGAATGIGKVYDSTLENCSFSAGWRFVRCALDGTLTITSAGDNYFDSCFGLIGAKIDVGAAVGAGFIELTHAAGEITVLNLQTGDNFVYGGTGRVVLDSTCTGGTVWIRGNVTLVNNGSGMTINQDARYGLSRILSDSIAFKGADIADILTDTGTTLPASIGTPVADLATDIAAVKTDAAAILVDTGTDGVKLNSTQPSGWADNLVSSAGQIIKATVDTVTNTHTPTETEFQADDITEATADHYNGRIIVFTSGVLAGQATNITDYAAVGGIGQFTVTALTEPPSDDDTFIIL